MSPITVKVARWVAPIVPAKTWPSLTPICSGSGRSRVGDRAQGAEQPALVVGLGPRHAADQDDLAAVLVDVAGQEGHAGIVGRDLHGAHDRVQGVGHRVGPARREQRVDPAEPDERHGGDPVLELDLARPQVLAEDGRQARIDGLGGQRSPRTGTRWAPPALAATAAPRCRRARAWWPGAAAGAPSPG